MKRAIVFIASIGSMVSMAFIVSMVCIACDNAPEGVMSKGKMTEVLYDYHIAQAMYSELSKDYDENQLLRLEAVYRKHGITEAEFDSSMVYYNRHPKEMKEIYGTLKDRYTEVQKDLQLLTGNNNMMVFTEGGDTADIWTGKPLYVLHANDYENKESFFIEADTSFHQQDAFRMTANIGFHSENMSSRQSSVVICYSLHLSDGRTISNNRCVSYPGTQQIDLEVYQDDLDIESLSGFFYFDGQRGIKDIAIIENVALYRMHKKREIIEESPEVSADSTAVDSLKTDSLKPDTLKPEIAEIKHEEDSSTPNDD